MALSGSVSTSTYEGRGLTLSWSAKQDTSKNQSTISWSLKPFGGSSSWYSTGPIKVTIDGTVVYNYTGRTNMYLTWSTSGSLTLDHASDGSKSFKVSVEAAIYTFAVNCTGSKSFTLDKIARNPSAPTKFSISAGFGNYVGLGDKVTLSWSGASGVITGYELQYQRGNTGWKAWTTIKSTATSGSTTDSFTATDVSVNGAGVVVQYRIRALNGSLASAWVNSNKLTMLGGMELKVNGAWKTGSVWINVNGTWKRAKRVWIKVNGNWKYSI